MHRDTETTAGEVAGMVQEIGGVRSGARGPALRLVLSLVALVAALCLCSAPAQAWEGIHLFEMQPNGTQAGGHPDVHIRMEWDNSHVHNGEFAADNNPCQCDDARVITDRFPTGFIGNPHAVPTCEIAEFAFGRCPASSQVGTVRPVFENFFSPMYNITPHPDEASLVAFWVPLISAPVFISLSARTESDYGLNAESSPIYHIVAISAIRMDLWGVPADHVHDKQRFIPPLKGFAGCSDGEECANAGIGANIPPRPYIEAPTQCGVPLSAGLDVEYYTRNVYHSDIPWPSTTGCAQLTFSPSLTAQPTTTEADTPSGVDIDLKVPQEQSPTTPSPSEIRSVTTTLPAGFSINSNVADGKAACSDDDTAIGTRHGATCPEFAKVGTLSLDSSAMPTAIPGAIYLGEPKPGDPYRLILAANGYGTHIKIAGSVHADPADGQLQISFPELPQSPLTEFSMHFFGSERGLLATPTQCGSYPVESEFVPWDDALPNQTSVSSFEVTAGAGGGACPNGPRPFSPQLRAGVETPSGGVQTPFSFELTRADGEQNLASIGLTLPPGLLATLKGIPYCPDSALAEVASASGLLERATPKCPVESQIGTVAAGAGAGSRPVNLSGKVYLAGPYKGAPLSLAVVTPAVSGPYDLGNVVVRSALDVDPVTARASVASDPITQILGGIPLRLRTIQIKLDRPGFTVNPTNCDAFSIDASIGGDEGATAHPSSSFQVANCASLDYRPKLSMKLTGGVKRRGHPAIHALLTSAAGESNSREISVTLPKGEQLDNAHVGNVCTKVQFAAGNCPSSSLLGSAEAVTPLLGSPLKGDVYLRSSDHGTPDLAMLLKGQIDIELAGRIDVAKNGGLRTTFEGIPDARISSFRLDLLGGKKGLLINSGSLCSAGTRAIVGMTGQNGARRSSKTKLQTPCGSPSRHKRLARKAGH